MTPQSLAEFARGLGVSPVAITKAIASGRLNKSVGKRPSGRPMILDPGLALEEWNGNSQGRGDAGLTLIEWQRQLTMERARAQKIANDLREGELVEARTVERVNFEAARTIRESVLNILDRLSAELAAETDERKVHARLEKELRQALETAAKRLRGKKSP